AGAIPSISAGLRREVGSSAGGRVVLEQGGMVFSGRRFLGHPGLASPPDQGLHKGEAPLANLKTLCGGAGPFCSRRGAGPLVKQRMADHDSSPSAFGPWITRMIQPRRRPGGPYDDRDAPRPRANAEGGLCPPS